MSSRSDPTSPAAFFSGRTAWARSVETPLRKFLRTETGGAAVLLAATVAALVWVNVDASSYDSLWRTKLSIDVDDIRAHNPNIIYVRGSGQGDRGPDADKGSYDSLAYWARAGIAYNPLNRRWHLSRDLGCNYMVAAQRPAG